MFLGAIFNAIQMPFRDALLFPVEKPKSILGTQVDVTRALINLAHCHGSTNVNSLFLVCVFSDQLAHSRLYGTLSYSAFCLRIEVSPDDHISMQPAL
jgi:hypothetical protein